MTIIPFFRDLFGFPPECRLFLVVQSELWFAGGGICTDW